MNIHLKKSMSYYFCVISCKQTKSYSYNSDGMTNTLVLVCRLPLLPTLININKLGFCFIRECVILQHFAQARLEGFTFTKKAS